MNASQLTAQDYEDIWNFINSNIADIGVTTETIPQATENIEKENIKVEEHPEDNIAELDEDEITIQEFIPAPETIELKKEILKSPVADETIPTPSVYKDKQSMM